MLNCNLVNLEPIAFSLLIHIHMFTKMYMESLYAVTPPAKYSAIVWGSTRKALIGWDRPYLARDHAWKIDFGHVFLSCKNQFLVNRHWSGEMTRGEKRQPTHPPTPLPPSPSDKMAVILSDDIFKCIFLNLQKFCILIEISLELVPKFPIDNRPTLVLIMVWHRIGDKPLSGPMFSRFTDAYAALGGLS